MAMITNLSVVNGLQKELRQEIESHGIVKDIPKNTEILREGQYIKVIPIVIEGLIKVFSRYKDKELLLYYIQPNESCVMSFIGSLQNEPSKVIAVTEEDTKALLLPVEKVLQWIKQYPKFNAVFLQQYNLRYADLLDTINHLLFDSLDVRLYHFLQERIALKEENPIKLSHRQIANELGTAREVITRLLKKLEAEGKIIQFGNAIEVK